MGIYERFAHFYVQGGWSQYSAVNWQQHPSCVLLDTTELFQVNRPDYDFEQNIATVRLTGFAKDGNGNGWHRMNEEHRERGYTLGEIRRCLEKADLQELACWDSLQEMGKPKPNSGRLWFVTRKARRDG